MGNTHQGMVESLSRIEGYRPYFAEAFGSPDITKTKVAKAIADYERTRISGNSPWDRWRRNRDQDAVSAESRRLQDANASRSVEACPLHARRLGADVA